MEILAILVKFIDTIAWPVVVLITIYAIKPMASDLFSFLGSARSFEMELGGQKLKFDYVDESLKKTISRGIELKAENPDKDIDDYIHDQSEIISVISELSQDDIGVVEHIGKNPNCNTSEIATEVLSYNDNTFETEYRKAVRILKKLRGHELLKKVRVESKFNYSLTNKGMALYELIKDEKAL